MRRRALLLVPLAACGAAWADPPAGGGPTPRPSESAPQAVAGPAWLREPRSESDRALLRRLLDPAGATREAAVAAWEQERIATEERARKAGGAFPPGPRTALDDWAEKDDDAPAEGEAERVRQEFWNRARALARGLTAALQGAGSPAVRTAAARSVGDMLLPLGRRLTASLSDRDAEVRLAAAKALTRFRAFEARYPDCLPRMLGLLSDPDGRVRAAALDAMAAYGEGDLLRGEDGAVVLARLLAATEDPAAAEVRRAALLALYHLAGLNDQPEVVRAFTRALGDRDGGVRSVAARGFAGVARSARRSDRWAVNRNPRLAAAVVAEDAVMEEAAPLLERLLVDPDPATRRISAYAYWQTGGETALVLPILVEAMRGAHGSELIAPLSILAEIGPEAEAATPAVVATLGEDTVERFFGDGEEAMNALYSIGPAAAVALPPLERALRAESAEVRAAAAGAFAAVEGDAPACARCLMKALERERDPAVRGTIHEALGRLGVGGDLLVADLVRALDGPDVEAWGATAGLARLGTRAGAAVRALEGRARESAPPEDRAAWALGLVGGPAHAARALGSVRAGAARDDLVAALAGVGPKDAALVPDLLASLPGAPAEVADVLSRIGPGAKAALPALVRQASAGKGRARIAAAEAVVRIGGERAPALKVLVEALADQTVASDDLRAAAYALARIGEAAREAVPALRTAYRPHGGQSSAAVAFALWRLTGEVDPWLDAILDGVASSHPSPEPEVLASLGEMGAAAARAVPALEHQALVWTREGYVRRAHVAAARAAIRALGEVGPSAKASLPTLRRLRRNALFRDVAAEAIRRIGGT